MSTATQTRFTPEDLLTMPDGDDYELVDGQLVERKMSVKSSWTSGKAYFLLQQYAEAHGGWAFPDGTSYQCFPWDPTRVRKPDASFIAAGRFENDRLPDAGHNPVVPDLAVEVVSPNDLYQEVDQKVEDYLEAGVRLVWVINPVSRNVRVHRGTNGPASVLHENDELSGEAILPGFTCRVADLFPPDETEAGERTSGNP